MSKWESLVLGDLFPEEIASIISGASTAVDGAAGITDALLASAEIASAKIVSFIDPLASIVDAFIDEIQGLVLDYFKAGVYVLAIPPGSAVDGYTQSTEEFLDVIINSLYDTADPNRPIFSKESGSVLVIIMVGAPSFEELRSQINGISKVFKLPSLNIDTIVDKLVSSVLLLSSIIPSLSPQFIKTDGDISLFPDKGIVKIGEEITTYSYKKETGIGGVIVRGIHDTGETVTAINLDKSPIGTSSKLTSSIIGTGLETEIAVETTDGFPYKGSIFIEGEEVFYDGKTDTSFKKSFPKVAHESGITVTLGEGSSFHGSPPDWENIVLSDLLVELDFIFNELYNLSEALRTASEFSEVISVFLEQMRKKIEDLRKRITGILESISKFVSLLEISDVNILTVTGSGSTESIVEAIRSSTDKPDFDETAFTAGLAIIAGAGNASLLTGLFGS